MYMATFYTKECNSMQYFMYSQYNVKSRKMSRPAHKSMQ